MQINLAWAASTSDTPYSNFGDALNPILLHLLTGREITHSNFDSNESKLVAIGTILQDFRNGKVDVWGTGLDVRVPCQQGERRYFDPRITNVDYCVHAVRGIMTAHTLSSFGVNVPKVYGDPAILLRRLLHSYVKGERQDKLGMVCHLSELQNYTDFSEVSDLELYKFDSEEAKVISPLTKPFAKCILEKIKEIASYNFILSRSLHGLIIADIFDIPCAYYTTGGFESGVYSIFDNSVDIDHRFRDYYSGIGRTVVPVYVCPDEGIDVDDAKQFLTRNWEPFSQWDAISERLVNALPFCVDGYTDHTEFASSIDALKL
jgi:pyruvyltransferase